MNLINKHSGLYTDHYELTMAQGYFLGGMQEVPAVFDYHFRKCPYSGGYAVFSGLDELLEFLEGYRFSKEDIGYLSKVGFERRFLTWLREFRFSGDVYAVQEGEVIFPHEPCIRIEGNLIETQLVETVVLNFINFSTLIATKAARIKSVARNRMLMDFGLRRAHGFGGIQASRAAIAGGFDKTSNVYSSYHYGLEPTGTMAHSWVQSFDDELSAFRKYAELFPDHCVLLVDTYDTLNSGIPNAIKVGKEMEEKGEKLMAIRLDSGDLSYLSKKARKMLDMAGLDHVQIVASNQLDEQVISSLLEQSAPIDAFGVGTALVTGKGSGALDGVYKLSMVNGKPTMKLSDNLSKTTLPGRKELYRFRDEKGNFQADGIALAGEEEFDTIYHPFEPGKESDVKKYRKEKLVRRVMENGKRTEESSSPDKISEYMKSALSLLPEEHKRMLFPHIYKVGISIALLRLRDQIISSKNR